MRLCTFTEKVRFATLTIATWFLGSELWVHAFPRERKFVVKVMSEQMTAYSIVLLLNIYVADLTDPFAKEFRSLSLCFHCGRKRPVIAKNILIEIYLVVLATYRSY